jgi:hypothetical protein
VIFDVNNDIFGVRGRRVWVKPMATFIFSTKAPTSRRMRSSKKPQERKAS